MIFPVSTQSSVSEVAFEVKGKSVGPDCLASPPMSFSHYQAVFLCPSVLICMELRGLNEMNKSKTPRKQEV